MVNKATALTQTINRQLHPKPDDDSRVSPALRSAIQKSGMVLLDDFGEIVLKTEDLCSAGMTVSGSRTRWSTSATAKTGTRW